MDGRPGRRDGPGGDLTDAEVDVLAHVTIAGISPVWMLNCKDPLQADLVRRVAQRVLAIQADIREDQAVRIANDVIKGLGGK